jgi:putative heme iron utilization protein
MTRAFAPEAASVRALMRGVRAGALATEASGGKGAGFPFASLVTLGWDMDASPIFLFSELADHTRNIRANPNASLLVEAQTGLKNPQTGARVSLMGRVKPTRVECHARRFLARHPEARSYAGFADFNFYRMIVRRARYVGGFAKAAWIEGRDLVLGGPGPAAMAACEAGVVAHMNEEHADVVGLYARALLGRKGDGWRVIGVDPEGIDLRRGPNYARLAFPTPVSGAAACREALKGLARGARARCA